MSKESHKIEERQEIVTWGQPCRKVSIYLLLPLFGNRALWGYLPCKSGRVPCHAKVRPSTHPVMRNALEEVMTKVPLEYSSSSTKAYLAECILRAAGQGQVA